MMRIGLFVVGLVTGLGAATFGNSIMNGKYAQIGGRFIADTRLCAISASPCGTSDEGGGFLSGTQFLLQEDGTLLVQAKVVPGRVRKSATFDVDGAR